MRSKERRKIVQSGENLWSRVQRMVNDQLSNVCPNDDDDDCLIDKRQQ